MSGAAGSGGLAVRVCYHVPVIWVDRAARRERLAVDLGRLDALVPRLPDAEIPPAGPGKMLPDWIERDGVRWRLMDTVSGGGLLAPAAVLAEFWAREGRVPFQDLRIGIAQKLTSAAGMDVHLQTRGGLLPRVAGALVERFDAPAEARARGLVEGRRLLAGPGLYQGFVDAPAPVGGVVPPHGIEHRGWRFASDILGEIDDLATRDADVDAHARRVRRILALAYCDGIPGDGWEAALSGLREAALHAVPRHPSPAARDRLEAAAAELTGLIGRIRYEPAAEDVADLAALAPG